MTRFTRTLIALAVFALLAGCGQNARKGAAQGGSVGAVSGAVGGLVSALVFGGDPAQATARGMVYGGAVGATSGAISGNQVDSRIKQQQQEKEEAIRKKIGADAFKGLSDLVNCNHAGALEFAAKAQQQANPNYSVSGIWLELLTYDDQGDTGKAAALLPVVVQKDWEMYDEASAGQALATLRTELLDIRGDYNLPQQCE